MEIFRISAQSVCPSPADSWRGQTFKNIFMSSSKMKLVKTHNINLTPFHTGLNYIELYCNFGEHYTNQNVSGGCPKIMRLYLEHELCDTRL